MAYSVGPKQGGMAPRGFMMGGMRQVGRRPRMDDRKYDEDPEQYKKDLAEYERTEKIGNDRFFAGVDRDIQASMPWWMR